VARDELLLRDYVLSATAESDLTFVRTFVLFVSLERNESRRAGFLPGRLIDSFLQSSIMYLI